jgi:hypothetical protein
MMRTIRTLLLSAATAIAMNGAAMAAGTNAAATTTPSASADDQRIICRKTLETGSLVKKNKQCFTKAEWDKIHAAQREGNQKLFDGLSGRCGQDGGVC